MPHKTNWRGATGSRGPNSNVALCTPYSKDRCASTVAGITTCDTGWCSSTTDHHFHPLGLLLLTAFALLFAQDRIRDEWRSRAWRAAPLGLMLIPLMFLFASAGSAIADRSHAGERPSDRAYLAWISQTTRLPDGSCPRSSRRTALAAPVL